MLVTPGESVNDWLTYVTNQPSLNEREGVGSAGRNSGPVCRNSQSVYCTGDVRYLSH